MNEVTMKLCEEAVKVAAKLLEQRDHANAMLANALRERDDALRERDDSYEAFRIVVKERDTLREKVRSLTDLLADAEAKIEGFTAALDTEACR